MERGTKSTEILRAKSGYARSNVSNIARSMAAISSENYQFWQGQL